MLPGFGVLLELRPYQAATGFVCPELDEKAAMRARACVSSQDGSVPSHV